MVCGTGLCVIGAVSFWSLYGAVISGAFFGAVGFIGALSGYSLIGVIGMSLLIISLIVAAYKKYRRKRRGE